MPIKKGKSKNKLHKYADGIIDDGVPSMSDGPDNTEDGITAEEIGQTTPDDYDEKEENEQVEAEEGHGEGAVDNAEEEAAESDNEMGDKISYEGAEKEGDEGNEIEENDEDGENEAEQEETGEEHEPTVRETEEENAEEDGCLYNFTKKSAELSDVEDDDNEVYEDEVTSPQHPVTERISKPFLTKYERVRIKGARAKQLLLGAKPMIKNVQDLPPEEIAELEIENGVIPFKIERPLPDGTIETWSIGEFRNIKRSA